MPHSMSHAARFASIALVGAMLAACSKHGAPATSATSADGPGPIATAGTPYAVAARADAVDAAAPVTPTKVVTGDRSPSRARSESEADYYPEPARRPEPEFVKDMRLPYTDLGPAESRYFAGKFIDSDVMEKAMRKRDFDSQVLDLQNEGDAGAPARTQAYGAAIQTSLRPFAGRAQLGRFGCGKLLCMGVIRTAKPDWIPQWIENVHKQPLPMPSTSINAIRTAPDSYEVRFSFTTRGHGGFKTSAR